MYKCCDDSSPEVQSTHWHNVTAVGPTAAVMSRRQSTHRKSTSKSSTSSVSDTTDRPHTRRKSKTKARVVSESPDEGLRRSPLVAREDQSNLSQFFPAKKRSQASPQTPSRSDRRFTSLKSLDCPLRKRILLDSFGETPVGYGEESCLDETPAKVKHTTRVGSEDQTEDNNSEEEVKNRVNCKSGTNLLSSFVSAMEELPEDEMVSDSEDQIRTQIDEIEDFSHNNHEVDSLSQRLCYGHSVTEQFLLFGDQ